MRTIHVSRTALEPWAILPEALAVISEIVTRHFAGEKLDAEEVQTRIHGAKRPGERISGDIAVLPLFGTIFPRANMFTDVSGATSAEMFGKRFDALMNDPAIGAIVMDVDSPGGQVPGIEELSEKIYTARGRKPIVAVANHLMASAAYWIGSAADELIVSPSGEVGSIGVFAMHQDVSKALEQQGVKMSLISAGKYKTEGNAYEPLSDEARGAIQTRVEEYYERFVAAVARNRGVKAEDVRSGFGEGRLAGSEQAVSLGMADRIATLDETIEGLARGGWARQNRSAESVVSPGMAEDDLGMNVTGDAGISEAKPDAEGEPNPMLPPGVGVNPSLKGREREAEAETLRNYLDVFGPKKGGE